MTKRSLKGLAERMRRAARDVDRAAAEATAATAVTIVGKLAFATPVDTSQAISNWVASLNAPPIEFLEPHYPGEKGSTQQASALETIAAAKLALKVIKAGDTVYVTNNAPYIRRLNEGHSQQAPAGFIEVALGSVGGRSKRLKLKF